MNFNKQKKSRRNFLKKAVYATPSLFVLGHLVKPTTLNALSNIPDPFSQVSPKKNTKNTSFDNDSF